jgi:putative tryptophan/tyrosine transport system substrate-binding protein
MNPRRLLLLAPGGHLPMARNHPRGRVDAAVGPSNVAMLRQRSGYAARILHGATPAVAPIEAPTKVELVIKLKTAQTPGIQMPRSLLLRADEVVD